MDNFKIIYRILRTMEKAMDVEELNRESIGKEALDISEARWNRIMAMLAADGYITGVNVQNTFDRGYPTVMLTRPEITLKGLEYLEENCMMKRAADIAKGIREIIPGI